MSDKLVIREAVETDMASLKDIYNYYVRQTHVTFDLEEVSIDNSKNWFTTFNRNDLHRLFVAEIDQEIMGYACSSQFRSKPAYDLSVETTIYLDHTVQGTGYGAKLYQHLLRRLADTRVHRCYGIIALPNPASVALHARLGFTEAGRLSEVGYKFGQYWDTLWMEKIC